MKQVLARICNSQPAVSSPPICPWCGANSQLGGVLWVCLCYVLTLVFSLPASTPLSYCLARWLPRYFSTCSSWSWCMLDPGACCCGLPSPDGLNENSKGNDLSPCIFLPDFSELGDYIEKLEPSLRWYTMPCFAALCGGAGEDFAQ